MMIDNRRVDVAVISQPIEGHGQFRIKALQAHCLQYGSDQSIDRVSAGYGYAVCPGYSNAVCSGDGYTVGRNRINTPISAGPASPDTAARLSNA